MRKTSIYPVLLFVAAVAVTGCESVITGPGGPARVEYAFGWLVGVESAELDEVYTAALKAVRQLELQSLKKSSDELSARIVARDSQERVVTVKLDATVQGCTRISIWFGPFGDETKSKLIYRQIRTNLYAPQQAGKTGP